MRYVDFKSVIKESILNEGLGYTKGDLAETVWKVFGDLLTSVGTNWEYFGNSFGH